MIRIVQITDADAPAAVLVPPFQFNDPVTSRAYRNAVIGKNIRPFVDAAPAPAAPVAPCAPVAVIVSGRDRERLVCQLNGAECLVNLRLFRNQLHGFIPFVIMPQRNFKAVVVVCVKFFSKGQMSGKKWEDALSFKCTLVGEYI